MKRHQTQVADWMTRDPICVSPSTSVAEAYAIMRENEIRRLLVVQEGELVGIVTLSDLQRNLPGPLEMLDPETRLMRLNRRVQEVMTYDPGTIDPEDTIQECAERMLDFQVSGLPVIQGGRPVGIITESDIFRLVVESWSEEGN